MKKVAYHKLMGLDKQSVDQSIDYGPRPNTIKSTLQDIVRGSSILDPIYPIKGLRYAWDPITPAQATYNWFKNRNNSVDTNKAPMNKPTWEQRLWARVADPKEYVRQNIYYNPEREQKLLRSFDPHPAATSGVNSSKVDGIRDYLKKSIKGGLNPAAADQLQLGKMFGPKDKGLHKVVGKPNTAIKSYIDTARVAHRGDLARQMLAIRNSKKNKPGMWDILFNRWSWDE